MDDLDKKLLTKIQFDFPLDLRPFLRLAEQIRTTEEEVIARLAQLRKENVIRQISAIFDTRNLGYTSSLVAMRIPSEKLSAGARMINAFPGVSHNYKRENHFNLWFTVAVPPGRDLNETVRIMACEAEAETTLVLPTLKLFKIGVRLDVTGKSDGLEQEGRQEFKRVRRTLSTEEREIVKALQQDLRLIPHPFEPAARQIGISEGEVFGLMKRMTDEGIMRRFAGVLHHRKAGFAFNGMGVWKVPPEKIEELGYQMGSYRGVSHCYQRPTYPEWDYSLYTMVHGMKQEDCERIIQGIAEATGIKDYLILYSTVEYKKDRIDYFCDEFDEWYKTHTVPPSFKPVLRTVESYAEIY
ncbi:MAG: Lrp/AsnC family transcriptional regulator [Deltaproteobacteria bacterium]|nr:Lrp/AsnC family transcriptional regulator [Deltaproteobacteria bacterium]MBI4374536.1 Lrp/AsnC family transcriptional regulator [Deltaproteobacteria bacterium]